jgi:hypothetical protein
MATVTTSKPFNHEETQRRVRSPLQLVRSYIRRYIFLEGLALLLLAAALLFWLGLAFDFGLFKFDFELLGVHGIDWILLLNDLDTSGNSSLACRVIFLLAVVIGLLAFGFYKVGLRWFREFNDRAIALVLERRFHKELGDRLITAVELANPKLSKKYGYSQAMVEKTISEAVQILKTLPIAAVFNWRRLYVLWFLVGVATVGLLLVNMIVFCGGSYFVTEPMNPYVFGWKFYDTASIWTERNVLMMKTYWPRRAHLEIGRFQPSALDPNDMRVPMSDDQRPALTVRAFEWVIADRDEKKAPYGWRPLTWKDLSEHQLVDAEILKRVQIPADFSHWQVDPEELEPNLTAALFGAETRVRPISEVNEYLAELHAAKDQANDLKLPWENRRAIKAANEPASIAKVRQWLDWTEWTVDKLGLQKEEEKFVRPNLRIVVNGHDQYKALEQVFSQLEELADAPSMGRTLRRLNVPAEVHVRFVGAEKNFTESPEKKDGNKYEVPLVRLADSPKFRFRARAENYLTPPKTISLVAAPAPESISIDKDEPAYIYHHLNQPDQTPLRGLRHETRDLNLPTTGDINTIEIPLGSDLTIHIRTDRKLRPERSIDFSKLAAIEPGYDSYRGRPPVIDADQSGFKLVMTNLVRKHDFTVEFFDEDNIRGKRRFKILSVIDTEPQVGNLNIGGVAIPQFPFNLSYQGVLLRKPKFKAPAPLDKEKDKEGAQRDYKEQAELGGAYLITPDALLPFECSVKDDYGLTSVGYNFKLRKADVELMTQGGGGAKVPVLQIDQAGRRANAALVASNFQFLLGSPLTPHERLGAFGLAQHPKADEIFACLFGGQYHLAYTTALLRKDLHRTQGYREGYVSCDGFQNLLERKLDKMISLNMLNDLKQRPILLSRPRSAQTWDFDFKEDDGFDVRKHLPELKTVDLEKTAHAGQQHYYLQIAVQAVDNNVETGSHLDDKGDEKRGNKKSNRNGYIGFLIISENELLTQISLEEESLSEKLEGAKQKVDDGIISLKEQIGKVADPKTDMDNVLNRMNEIRTALASAGNTVRDAHKAYENILREMAVNRVRSDRMTKIADRIAAPLKDIVLEDRIDPAGTGSFPHAEDAFQIAQQLVEDDVNQKREPVYATHSDAMRVAESKLNKLSLDIKRVLDAMSEGIVESKLIAIIAALERIQIEKTQEIERRRAVLIGIEIERLLQDQKMKDPMPKKEEKKSSQLRVKPPEAQQAASVSDGFSGASPVAHAAGSYGDRNRKAQPAVLFAPAVLNCTWVGSALRQSTA